MMMVVLSHSEVLRQLAFPVWDGIPTELLDENVRNGHSVSSGLVLSHRSLMLNFAVFECCVPFLPCLLTVRIHRRLVGVN